MHKCIPRPMRTGNTREERHMRKMNSAVKSVLAATMAMGTGAAIIVTADVMTHGTIPTAVAADNLTATITTNKNQQDGHVAVFSADDNTFSTSGTITIGTSTNDSSRHTGPFTATFKLPDKWKEKQATFQSTSFEATNMSDADKSRVSVSSSADDGTTCIVTVGREGLRGGQQLVISYSIKTPTLTFETNIWDWNHAGAIAAMQADLDNWSFVEPNPNPAYATDWTNPGYTKTITVNDVPNPSQPVLLAPGRPSVSGSVTFRFTGNSSHVQPSGITLTGDAANAFELVPDGAYKIKRAGASDYSSETLSPNAVADFNEGDEITLSFSVRARYNFEAYRAMTNNLTAKLSASITVNGTTDMGQTIGSKPQETVSADLGVAMTSLSITGVTPAASENKRVTAGDTVEVLVPVRSSGYTHSGKLRVLVNNTDAPAVKITGVRTASGDPIDASSYSIMGDGQYVDINLPSMTSGTLSTYKIVVVCGSDSSTYDSLIGKTIKVNSAVAILDQSLDDVNGSVETLLQQEGQAPSGTQFQIVSPSMSATTLVTDPTFNANDDAAHYHDKIVTNLSDIARFKVTFSNPAAADGGQVVKGIKVMDSLTIENKSGESLSNDDARVDILNTDGHQVTLYKVSDGNTTPVNSATVSLSGPESPDHPYQIEVSAPSLDLQPGESIVLVYDVKMGHTEVVSSNRNMRGASVTNNPKIDSSNKVQLPVATPSTVKVATAQLSVSLNATKDEVAAKESTTYVMTVQSVEDRTTTLDDEYAIGLHVTTALDNLSRSYGYGYDLDSVKLYHVKSSGAVAIPPSAYTTTWVEQEEDSNSPEHLAFNIDLDETKANAYKIKNVSKMDAEETRSMMQSGDADGESAEAESILTAESSDEADIETLATQIKDGFIILFDGTTKDLRAGFAGEITSKTDSLARADNAGYAMNSKDVKVIGEEIITPTTGGKVPVTNDNGTNGGNGTGTGTNGSTNNGRQSTTSGPLLTTGIDAPMSVWLLIAGIAGWGLTWYRKIRRR